MIEIDATGANKKQRAFFLARERYVAYGGARGGGKSWAVRMKAAMLAVAYGGIKLLIVRRTLPELESNHIQPMRDMLPGVKWNEQKKRMTFANGSVIRFGYCDTEGDVRQYQGQEYDCIFLDEATQLTEYQYQTFKGCLRGVNDFPKRLYLTCNPGGVGHAWVKRLFIDRNYREGERAEDYRFIPAGVRDNAALMEKDPDYIRRLESLPYELREAWLNGNWDVMAGQYFSEWDRAVHVCDPFVIPEHWRRYVTMDYGTDMLAAYVIAVDEEGGCWVTREAYEGKDLGEGHEGLIISEAAERVKELAGDEDIYLWLAPPDLWGTQRETGRTTAEIFAEKGVYLTKAGNDRVSGWLALHELLRVGEDRSGRKSARLRIFGTCPNLIRTLPLLQYDEHRVNDVSNQPHEITHAPDALRYFASYWISNAAPPAEATPRKKLIDEMREKENRRKRRR